MKRICRLGKLFLPDAASKEGAGEFQSSCKLQEDFAAYVYGMAKLYVSLEKDFDAELETCLLRSDFQLGGSGSG